ncbi:MAG TPA: NADH-quinone oxidoreductase subunit C [Phycisphaerales bacterium]|nr:NADH-quinone oxidoreductase subunit C [Phycisphaerales bacterium]
MPKPLAPNLEHPTFAAVKARFPGSKFKATEYRGCSTLIVTPADLHAVMEFLKNDASTRYDFLSDVTAVDYLGYAAPQPARFGVVYILRSYEKDEMFIVKTFLDPSLPTDGIAEDPALYLDSVTDLWMGAEWMEREVFDMFGIRFRNHPDLRRILLWESYPAHPLRKDYPLRGRGEREDYRVVDRTDA